MTQMREFFFGLFFNNDPSPGYLLDLFGLEKVDSTLRYPFWILPALAILFAIAAYFVGSINFALVISKLVYHDDVRKYGSKNAGSTNMKRVYGMKAALLTLAGDILKGAVAVLIPKVLLSQSAAYLAGFACMLGHCFPAYFKFRGGKGVATAFAVIATLDPLVGLLLLAIFVLIVLATKYISMGSIMSALLFPVILDRLNRFLYNDTPPTVLMTVCALLMTVLVVLMHHTNIKRLMEGTENKFTLKKKSADGGSKQSKQSKQSKKEKKEKSGSDEKKVYHSLHTIDDEDDEGDSGEND